MMIHLIMTSIIFAIVRVIMIRIMTSTKNMRRIMSQAIINRSSRSLNYRPVCVDFNSGGVCTTSASKFEEYQMKELWMQALSVTPVEIVNLKCGKKLK